LSQPWISDKWFVSPYNFAPDVVSKHKIPSKVELYDVSLRDGEQCPGVVYRRDDKVKIAQALDAVGVHRIEAGMPVVSQEDFEAVRDIARLGLKAKIKAFCRARRDDVDVALKCDVWGVLIELPSSKILIDKGYQWTEERVIEMAVDTAQYAKSHGLHVTFFNVDSTRADLDFLRNICIQVVSKSKVDAIAVVDTFGVASPFAISYLINQVSSWVNVPLEVHLHNDMAMATANSLAAVAAGASVVHTNVNGMSERSGGAALEEVAVALRLLLGVDLGLNYSKLMEVSKLVQRISRVAMPPTKPVVGEQSFAYEAGIAVMFSERFREAGYLQGALPYLPEFVGNSFKVFLGKKSGRHSIEAKVRELKLKVAEDKFDDILARVKDLSISKGSAVTDEEFKRIVAGVAGR